MRVSYYFCGGCGEALGYVAERTIGKPMFGDEGFGMGDIGWNRGKKIECECGAQNSIPKARGLR